MQTETREVELAVDGRPMRTVVVTPRGTERHPGIVLCSEIFQLTAPIRRAMERLAGHGFVVAGHEIYHRIEAPGVVIPYDDDGRTRGMSGAQRTRVAEYDRDLSAVLDHLEHDERVKPESLGSMGFCIGGHLALRAALDPRVKATVACYPTGVHNGKLGADADAGTLAAMSSIRGEVLVVFGSNDPHVPLLGRATIARGLQTANVRHRIAEFDAEHAFMRDEGARYDSAASDAAWVAAVELFQRTLSN